MPDWNRMFAEAGEYLHDKYYSPGIDDLAHLDGANAGRMLPYLCLGVSGGIFFAACIAYYNGEYLGKIVQKLHETSSFSPGEAKTLSELGCDRAGIRRNLCKDSVLSRYVKTADVLENAADAKTARFYLCAETKEIALKRFRGFRGGKRTLGLLFGICAALYFLLLYCLPDALRLFDNAIGLL